MIWTQPHTLQHTATHTRPAHASPPGTFVLVCARCLCTLSVLTRGSSLHHDICTKCGRQTLMPLLLSVGISLTSGSSLHHGVCTKCGAHTLKPLLLSVGTSGLHFVQMPERPVTAVDFRQDLLFFHVCIVQHTHFLLEVRMWMQRVLDMRYHSFDLPSHNR